MSKVYAIVTSIIIVAIVATIVRNQNSVNIINGGGNLATHIISTALGNG